MRTPISYYGGKQQLSAKILPLIPAHTTYVEPFFGGGAIFFAKPSSKVEVINDLNGEAVNFYRQCVSNFEGIQARIRSTLHSRQLYRDALVIYNNPHLFTELERAWAFWVTTNQGYACKIGTWGYANTCSSSEKKTMNKRLAFDETLHNRLAMVQIECMDALYVIQRRDTAETFFYCDPPYYNSDMGHYGGYSVKDYENLLELLASINGKFLLSSYPSDVLDEYKAKHGWHQTKVEMPCSASTSKRKKVEVLTSNYPMPLTG